jgi:hypothetical protein
MTSTISTSNVVSAELALLYQGAWTGSVRASSEVSVGAATLTVEGQAFGCYVRESSQDGGSWRLDVIGGKANGWRAPVEAKCYRQVTAQTILDDLTREAGETLSSTVDAALLSRPLALYHRSSGRVWTALDELAAAIGSTWRVLADGTLWLGADTWAAGEAASDVLQAANADTSTVHTKAPVLRPGMTWRGRKAERVDVVLESNALRVLLWTQDPARLTTAAIQRQSGARGARLYPAEVVSQGSDGMLEVLVDHPDLRGTGMAGLELWTGIDGLKVELEKGDRVLVGFLEGSQAKPFAMLSPNGGTAKKITITAGTPIVLENSMVKVGGAAEFVALADKVKTELDKIKTAAAAAILAVTPSDGGAAAFTAFNNTLSFVAPASSVLKSS